MPPLKNFETCDTSAQAIAHWKSTYPRLKHVKTGPDFQGVLLYKGPAFVAVLQTNQKTGYIVALEVAGDFRSLGVAAELLGMARTEYHCSKLSVSITNVTAQRLYRRLGFQEFDRSQGVIYMEYQR